MEPLARKRVLLSRFAITIALVILLVADLPVLGSGFISQNQSVFAVFQHAYASSLGTLTKTKSGLVAQDSLTHNSINTKYWFLYGDAIAEHAPYSYSENATGLHVAVEAPSAGQWAGFYAESPNSPARLYSALLSVPFKSTPDHWWDSGLYVQTSSSSAVNYVTCAAIVSTAGITWQVLSAKGNSTQATQFTILWTDSSPNQPYTRNCTIFTNGINALIVYLDNKLVYSTNSLNLQMPAPFNAYLEVQSSSATQMLTGTFIDFHATSGKSIQVTKAPPGGLVQLINPTTNVVLASSKVSSGGNANLDIMKYHMPLNASIKVYNSKGILTAFSGALSIWGGDTYSVSSGPNASTSPSSSALANGTTYSWNKTTKRHELPTALFK